MTPRDEDFIMDELDRTNVEILAAAYTIYYEMTPSNKKPISQQEFFDKYVDNWNVFSQFMLNK